MYAGVLQLHSVLRWLLLICLVVTLIKYMAGWFGNQPWRKLDNVLGIVLTGLVDLLLVTGLLLYFFLSPIMKIAFEDFGAAMKNADIRFFAVEHLLLMLIAVVLIHAGRAKSKKAQTDIGRFRTASFFYLIALMIIFAAIPWSRLAN